MQSGQDVSLGGYALFVFMALTSTISYNIFWLTKQLVRVFASVHPTLFMRLAGGMGMAAAAQVVLWLTVSFGGNYLAASRWVHTTQPFAPRWVLEPAQQMAMTFQGQRLPNALDATHKLVKDIDIQESVSKIKLEDIKEISLRIKNIRPDADAAATDMSVREHQKLDQINHTQSP
jgi:hypothetical protein